MKKWWLFPLVVILGIIGMATVSVSYPTAKNQTFQIGEKLRYRVTYGVMDAGEAVLEVKSTAKKPQGRELVHVVATGKTLGGFNAIYKVNDVYESYIDKKGAFPWEFNRDVNEGGYVIKQNYVFNQHKQQVKTEKGDINVPIGIQDMISSFYHARTLDFKNLKVGDIVEFQCFMDGEIWPLKIKYVGKDDITIRKGKFKCLKFVPVVQKGRYFKSEEDVNFWVTDDDNKIPIYVKAKIPVGVVKLHLVEWEGLRNPISKIK
ncbi:MAG: DUF3108 domain-containing protein [Flavobacteriia bacterium]|nr:DUF3108 domain-containing protein [Flavobacteriia bacterium]OJX35347.1 MAG: hypothetical protein BGO87_12130 [Flavobacteriia bacterium 40-80]